MEGFLTLYDKFILVRLIVWTVLFCVAWIALSGPFYIIRKVFLLYYDSLIKFIERSSAILQEFVKEKLQAIKQIHYHFTRNHQFKYALDHHEKMLDMRLESIKETGESIVSNINRTNDNIQADCKRFSDSAANLSNLEMLSYDPESLDTYFLPDKVNELRRGKTTFFVCLMFAVALIIYNTAMLNLFFSELIDIYIIYKIKLKVSHLLAFLFTMIEIALGYIHYISGKKKTESALGANVVQVSVILFALFLAFFEAFLYTNLSIELFQQLTEKVASADLPVILQKIFQYSLTPFGGVLVFMLFILGHYLFSSLDDWREAALDRTINKDIEDMKNAYADLNRNMDTMQNCTNNIKESAREYREEIAVKEGELSTLSTSLNAFLESVRSILSETHERRKNFFDALKDEEKLKLFYTHLAYAVGIIAVFIFLVYMENSMLQRAGELGIPSYLSLIMSISKVMILLVCGFYLRRPGKVVLEEEGFITVNNARSWIIRIICGIIIFLILGHTYLLTSSASSATFLVFTLMASCYCFLILVGSRLSSVVMTVFLAGLYLYTAIQFLGVSIGIVVLMLFGALFYVLRLLLHIIAQPMIVFLERG